MKFEKLISYILHPILIPIIGTLLYFIFLPKHTPQQLELVIIFSVFVGTYVVPLFLLFTLKKSKAIESFHLKNIQERKFPVLFFISITFLLSKLIRKGQNTMELALFFYGMTLALLIAYMLLYAKFKASLHMIGIGGLIGFFLFFSLEYQLNLLLLIAILFIIGGLIARSRLILKAHNQNEVYWGGLIGIISELAVYFYYNI